MISQKPYQAYNNVRKLRMSANYYPKDFIDKIEKAKKRLYAWPEIEDLIKNEQLLAGQFAYGNLSKKQFSKKLLEIKSKTPSMIVTSLAELDAVMKYLKTTDDVRNQTLADMQIKAEQSEEKGFATRFSLWFYKSITGNIMVYCGLQINLKNKKHQSDKKLN